MEDKARCLVLGKSSYIGSNLLKKLDSNKRYSLCSFGEFLKMDLTHVTSVVNCCFDNRLNREPYNEDYDLDLKALRHIAAKKASLKYVMLSSRAVYEPSIVTPLTEQSRTNPLSVYGKNKLIIEKKLVEISSDILILRISNVIGAQPLNHPTFASTALSSLKNTGKILVDIPLSSVKDFVPIEFLVNGIGKLLAANASGIINVGSSVGLTVGEFLQNIIDEFGSGEIEQTDNKKAEEFIMNIDKFKNMTQTNIFKEDVLSCLRKWVREFK